MLLSFCVCGVFAFDENGQLKAYALFRKDAGYIAETMERLRAGERVKELEDVIERLKRMDVREVSTDIKAKIDGIVVKADEEAGNMMRELFRKFAIDVRFASNMGELNRLLSEVSIIASRKTVKESIGRDRLVIHAINAVSDLDDISNRLIERLREWYSLHYPELNRNVKDHAKYASLIWNSGRRENIKGFGESMGMDIGENDEKALVLFAKETKEMFDLRDRLEKYVKEEMQRLAPNVTALAGHSIAARLLALSGSLEKLASLPAGTIQLLGAEKALFRHMKGGGRPPKFGVLFAHQEIQKAPKELKGKVARAIASKIAIAARVDYYSKEDRGTEMRKELDGKIRKITGQK